LYDTLGSLEEDISQVFIAGLEETIPSGMATLIGNAEDDGNMINEILEETFELNKVRSELNSFFEDFSAGDLFSEIRELATVEQLDDNLEFYLYLGEIKYEKNVFPLFYLPLNISIEKDTANLTVEPRFLVNKKAVDYASLIIQEENRTKRASPIKNRIEYLDEATTIYNTADGILQEVLMAFELEGSLSFKEPKKELKNLKVKLSNSVSLALFDKSDESMLTDYEELLQSLGSNSELVSFLESLVNGFLDENPDNIQDEVDEEWDDEGASGRLIFDTLILVSRGAKKDYFIFK